MANFEHHSSSENQLKLVFILQLLYPTVYTIYLLTKVQEIDGQA